MQSLRDWWAPDDLRSLRSVRSQGLKSVIPENPLALEIVDAGRPGEAGNTPTVLPLGFLCASMFGVHEAIDVEQAIEVVVLVLHDASKPAARLNFEGFTLEIDGTQQRALRAAKSEPFPGERQAPFNLIFAGQARFERGDPQLWIDGDAACGGLILVFVHPHEDALTNAHLRCGETDPGRCLACLEHVVYELTKLVIELGNRFGGAVQHGLAADRDGKNGHGDSF